MLWMTIHIDKTTYLHHQRDGLVSTETRLVTGSGVEIRLTNGGKAWALCLSPALWSIKTDVTLTSFPEKTSPSLYSQVPISFQVLTGLSKGIVNDPSIVLGLSHLRDKSAVTAPLPLELTVSGEGFYITDKWS